MPNPQVMVWKFQDQEDHGAVNVEYQNDSTAEPFYSSSTHSNPFCRYLGEFHYQVNVVVHTTHTITLYTKQYQPSSPATCRSGEQEKSLYNIEV